MFLQFKEVLKTKTKKKESEKSNLFFCTRNTFIRKLSQIQHNKSRIKTSTEQKKKILIYFLYLLILKYYYTKNPSQKEQINIFINRFEYKKKIQSILEEKTYCKRQKEQLDSLTFQ